MNFFLSTNIIIEIGGANRITDLIKDLPLGKVGVIYDAIIEDECYFNEILNKFSSKNDCIFYKNEFIGEPTYGHLENVASYFRKEQPSSIIVFGGGSTIDLAKGVALLNTNSGTALSYRGFPDHVNDPIPVITVPTLIGSGAEVSYNAVFIDEKEGRKLGINCRKNFPKITIIDPLLSMSAPIEYVVYSALDSLVHCIDSFGSIKHTPLSKAFSVQGFQHAYTSLGGDLTDPKTRLGLAVGSVCGTIALMNSGDGPTNGFAYYFGVKNKIPHGLAGAIFLVEVMRWNYEHGFLDYAYLNTNKSKMSLDESTEDLMLGLEKIYKKYDLKTISSYGYKKSEIKKLAADSSKALKGSFDGNPIKFNEKSAEEVLNKVI
ncbi:iron-containing alcohol dehydrogenase [bacterium]|nr:iron-containing alcohol dehydrogenase [bacterium]